MRRAVVRYKVKPDQAAKNEALVRAVYQELDRVKPVGLRYATFKLDDGLTFVHLVSYETDDSRNRLTELKSFQEFVEGVGARCDEAPVTTELQVVGAYRFFGE